MKTFRSAAIATLLVGCVGASVASALETHQVQSAANYCVEQTCVGNGVQINGLMINGLETSQPIAPANPFAGLSQRPLGQ